MASYEDDLRAKAAAGDLAAMKKLKEGGYLKQPVTPSVPAYPGDSNFKSVSVPQMPDTLFQDSMKGAFAPQPLTLTSSFDKVLQSANQLGQSVLGFGAAPGQTSSLPQTDYGFGPMANRVDQQARKAAGVSQADWASTKARLFPSPSFPNTAVGQYNRLSNENSLLAGQYARKQSGVALQDTVGGLDQLKNVQKQSLRDSWGWDKPIPAPPSLY